MPGCCPCTRRSVVWLLCTGLAHLVIGLAAVQTVWDATSECLASLDSVGNTSFVYGYLPTVPPANNSVFVPMDVTTATSTTVTFTSTRSNASNTPRIVASVGCRSSLTLLPGCSTSESAAIRWMAPRAGTYVIEVTWSATGVNRVGAIYQGNVTLATNVVSATDVLVFTDATMQRHTSVYVAVGPTSTTCSTTATPLKVTIYAVQQAWNANTDFAARNPNGIWLYGYTPSLPPATLHSFDVFNPSYDSCFRAWVSSVANSGGVPFAAKAYASGYGVTAGQALLHPGCSGEAAYYQWTSPATGWYIIYAWFGVGDLGSVVGYVYRNQNQLFAANVINSEASTVFHNVSVQKGDQLYIAVGLYTDCWSCTTPVHFVVGRHADPASWANNNTHSVSLSRTSSRSISAVSSSPSARATSSRSGSLSSSGSPSAPPRSATVSPTPTTLLSNTSRVTTSPTPSPHVTLSLRSSTVSVTPTQPNTATTRMRDTHSSSMSVSGSRPLSSTRSGSITSHSPTASSTEASASPAPATKALSRQPTRTSASSSTTVSSSPSQRSPTTEVTLSHSATVPVSRSTTVERSTTSTIETNYNGEGRSSSTAFTDPIVAIACAVAASLVLCCLLCAVLARRRRHRSRRGLLVVEDHPAAALHADPAKTNTQFVTAASEELTLMPRGGGVDDMPTPLLEVATPAPPLEAKLVPVLPSHEVRNRDKDVDDAPRQMPVQQPLSFLSSDATPAPESSVKPSSADAWNFL